MIKPEYYQHFAAKLSLDLRQRDREEDLSPTLYHLYQVIRNNANNHFRHSRRDMEYDIKCRDIQRTGEKLWQKLQTLTDAIEKREPPEKHKIALAEATEALRTFDHSLDEMVKGRFYEKFLLDNSIYNNMGSGLVREFSSYTPAAEPDPMGRPDNKQAATNYLHQLQPGPDRPSQELSDKLRREPPAPQIDKQFEDNKKPETPYRRLREEIAADRTMKYEDRLARTLAGIELERKNKPFDLDQIVERAKTIKRSRGFQAMAKNKTYVTWALGFPDRQSWLIHNYRTWQKMEDQKAAGTLKQSYENYYNLHVQANIPEEKEEEYLAKACACHVMMTRGFPFDKKQIRTQAQLLLKNPHFINLVHGPHAARDILDKNEVAAFTETLASMQDACAMRRMANYREHPEQLPEKSWEAYFDRHMRVPKPGKEGEYLSKAIVAMQKLNRDSPNSKFSVREARSTAAQIQKTELFRELMKEPQKVRELLEKGDPKELRDAVGATYWKLNAQKNPQLIRPVPEAQPRPERQPEPQPERQAGQAIVPN